MITVKNLYKQFGKNRVLQGINMTFHKGKVYGIVGENGSGKTTLFNCIAGLEDYEGEVFSERTPLKNSLGLLLTEPFIFSKITGKEYLKLLCQARHVHHINFEQKNIFDLPLEQYASTYSTGMKKKLALTAILLQQNEYFILDEPFNGLDFQSNILLTEIIIQLRALNKIVIVSSHIFSTLTDTCDLIYVLKKGESNTMVEKSEFANLEKTMKSTSISNKLDLLGLEKSN